MATRISTNQLFQNSQNHVSTARSREVTSMEKSASGKELLRPSQNPGAWAESSNLKDDLSIREAIVGNVNLAVRAMTAAENVFSAIQEKIQRMHEIAVSSAGTDGASEYQRQHNLHEAQQLYDGLIQVLNTKYANRTLFGGAKTDGPAFDPQGHYLGDNQVVEIEIERGYKLPMNVPAGQAILGEGVPQGVNIVETFKSLVAGLKENDADAVFSTIQNLVRAGDQISLFRSELAGRVNRMEATLNLHSEKKIETLDSVSKVEDADAVKVFSDLARDQQALQAALSTTKKVLDETPVDILFR